MMWKLGLGTGALVLFLTASASMIVLNDRWRQDDSSGERDVIDLVELAVAPPNAENLDITEIEANQVLVALSNDAVLNRMGSPSSPVTGVFLELSSDVQGDEDITLITAERDIDGTRWNIAVHACDPSAECATVAAGERALSRLEFATSRLATFVLPPLILGAAIGLLVALAAKRAIKPIAAMRADLDAVSDGDVERRVSIVAAGRQMTPLAESANGALDRLHELISSNERLVADIAHEMRSPLTSVRGALEIETMGDNDSKHDRSIAEIDRANQLLDDLLLLAKSPSFKSRLELIDVDDVIRYEMSRIAKQYPSIEIERAVVAAQARVVGESMNRIVRNLLDNAAKYGNGLLRVTLRSHGGQLMLRVDDNGSGIPVEEHERVLRRFGRSDQRGTASVEGTGLGMAIIDELIESHGGSLTLSRSPLGGCQAKVVMPTHIAEEATVTPPPKPLVPPRPAATSGVETLEVQTAPQAQSWRAHRRYLIPVGIVALALLVAGLIYWLAPTDERQSITSDSIGRTTDEPGPTSPATLISDDAGSASPQSPSGEDPPGDAVSDAADSSTVTNPPETTETEGSSADTAASTTADTVEGYDGPSTPAALDRGSWTTSASLARNERMPELAIDGQLDTRWQTGTPQRPGQWFQVDLGSVQTISRIDLILDEPNRKDFPQEFRVDVADSEDALESQAELVLVGKGNDGTTIIEFEPREARFARVSLLRESAESWWTISELLVYGS